MSVKKETVKVSGEKQRGKSGKEGRIRKEEIL